MFLDTNSAYIVTVSFEFITYNFRAVLKMSVAAADLFYHYDIQSCASPHEQNTW